MTTGERWAAAELHESRAGRFRTRAWQRFLSAAFGRATETRHARPELARQARIWSAAGLSTGIAVCAWPPFPAPRASRFALWWLATAAMLDWHLGMVEGPDGEHRDRLSAADALTLTRIALVPFLAAQGDPERASARTFTVQLVLAGASDALDGVLARRADPARTRPRPDRRCPHQRGRGSRGAPGRMASRRRRPAIHRTQRDSAGSRVRRLLSHRTTPGDRRVPRHAPTQPSHARRARRSSLRRSNGRRPDHCGVDRVPRARMAQPINRLISKPGPRDRSVVRRRRGEHVAFLPRSAGPVLAVALLTRQRSLIG
jgi:hypothetical protein